MDRSRRQRAQGIPAPNASAVTDQYTPERLVEILSALHVSRRYLVAYSGGMDSHVLLHALVHQRDSGWKGELRAVHVNHGLHRASSQWAEHCAAVCAQLEVDFEVLLVDASAQRKESPEAAARRARYSALATIMEEGESLLTAHHQDDQAETLLLQLLRGAGPRGLAAMPALTWFACGTHIRPLLNFSRAQLGEYARTHALEWIDDPSNFLVNYDRNHLRHRVWPLITERWPAAARTLSRSAAYQAEAALILDEVAAEDCARIADSKAETLSLEGWSRLEPPRQRNVLRYWIKQRGLPLPDAARLLEAQRELLHAARDRTPCVTWPGAELRRHRDRIYVLRPLPEVDPTRTWEWNMREPLVLADGTRLHAVASVGVGVRADLCRDKTLTIRYRQGGEECRPTPRGAARKIKQILQERAVPPWERGRLPLVYLEDALVAMVGVCVCAPFHAGPDEAGVTFALEPPPHSSACRSP